MLEMLEAAPFGGIGQHPHLVQLPSELMAVILTPY